MLTYSLRTLGQLPGMLSIVLVVGSDQHDRARSVLAKFGPWPVPIHLAVGGAERQDSVAAGLACADSAADLIVVHDAARPFVSMQAATECLEAAAASGAAIVAIPAHDTVKVVATDHVVVETLDRKTIWLAQTPQAFRTGLLRQSYARAQHDGYVATDDAMLVERLGIPVRVVAGEAANRKITTPDDLQWAEWYVRGQHRN